MNEKDRTCRWREDEDGIWDSGCGRTWEFDDGGPKANRCNFCMGCGKPVVEIPYHEPDREDDE